MFIVDILVKMFKFNIIFLLHFIVIIIVVKIPEMNSLYSGELWTKIFFLTNFTISAEMISLSLDDGG